MKKNKKSKNGGNGATHSYAGHVTGVEVAGGSYVTVSKKKGDARRFVVAGLPDAQHLAMIALASSAMSMGKKLHVEFAESGTPETKVETKVIAMRLGSRDEPQPSKKKPEAAEAATAQPA